MDSSTSIENKLFHVILIVFFFLFSIIWSIRLLTVLLLRGMERITLLIFLNGQLCQEQFFPQDLTFTLNCERKSLFDNYIIKVVWSQLSNFDALSCPFEHTCNFALLYSCVSTFFKKTWTLPACSECIRFRWSLNSDVFIP